MTYEVVWEESAQESLRRIPSWQTAARVARVVYDYARTGQGDVRRIGVSPTELRLYARPYCVRLSVEREARIVRVWIIFALR